MQLTSESAGPVSRHLPNGVTSPSAVRPGQLQRVQTLLHIPKPTNYGFERYLAAINGMLRYTIGSAHIS